MSFLKKIPLFMILISMLNCASASTENYRCEISRNYSSNKLILDCFFSAYPQVNNHFIGQRTQFDNATGAFESYESEFNVNPQCTYDDYTGQRYCPGNEYIESRYRRIGRFRSGFEEFKKLFEMREGSFGSGQVEIHCTDPKVKSDCRYEILNYKHMYWCDGRGCPN